MNTKMILLTAGLVWLKTAAGQEIAEANPPQLVSPDAIRQKVEFSGILEQQDSALLLVADNTAHIFDGESFFEINTYSLPTYGTGLPRKYLLGRRSLFVMEDVLSYPLVDSSNLYVLENYSGKLQMASRLGGKPFLFSIGSDEEIGLLYQDSIIRTFNIRSQRLSNVKFRTPFPVQHIGFLPRSGLLAIFGENNLYLYSTAGRRLLKSSGKVFLGQDGNRSQDIINTLTAARQKMTFICSAGGKIDSVETGLAPIPRGKGIFSISHDCRYVLLYREPDDSMAASIKNFLFPGGSRSGGGGVRKPVDTADQVQQFFNRRRFYLFDFQQKVIVDSFTQIYPNIIFGEDIHFLDKEGYFICEILSRDTLSGDVKSNYVVFDYLDKKYYALVKPQDAKISAYAYLPETNRLVAMDNGGSAIVYDLNSQGSKIYSNLLLPVAVNGGINIFGRADPNTPDIARIQTSFDKRYLFFTNVNSCAVLDNESDSVSASMKHTDGNYFLDISQRNDSMALVSQKEGISSLNFKNGKTRALYTFPAINKSILKCVFLNDSVVCLYTREDLPDSVREKQNVPDRWERLLHPGPAFPDYIDRVEFINLYTANAYLTLSYPENNLDTNRTKYTRNSFFYVKQDSQTRKTFCYLFPRRYQLNSQTFSIEDSVSYVGSEVDFFVNERALAGVSANNAVSGRHVETQFNGRGTEYDNGTAIDSVDYLDLINPILIKDDIFIGLGSGGRLTCFDFKSKKVLFYVMKYRGIDDYVVYNDKGFFDCQSNSVDALYWRTPQNRLLKLRDYYNDFFYPDLLFKSLRGASSPEDIPFYYYLGIPSLRNLIRDGIVSVKTVDKTRYLCFGNLSPIDLGLEVTQQIQLESVPAERIAGLEKYQLVIPLRNGKITDTVAGIDENRAIDDSFYLKKGVKYNLHFTAFGIDKYNPHSGLPNFDSDTSLTLFRNLFNQNKTLLSNCFDTLFYWPFLEDSAATYTGIQAYLASINRALKPNDLLVVYFSGHGGYPLKSEFFYFYPYDAIQRRGMECTNCIATPGFVDIVRHLKARRFLFIMDACQSGALVGGIEKIIDSKVEPGAKGEGAHFSYAIVTSSSPLELSVQDKSGGFLIRKVQELLTSFAGDDSKKILTLTDLTNVLQHKSADNKFEQTPMVVVKGENYPLFSKAPF